MRARTRVVPRYPVRQESVFLQDGFRPFFLGAGTVATINMALWIGIFSSMDVMPSGLWYAHEMLFGYGGAVVAGFLLTAAQNWTGSNRIVGRPLLYLFMLWVAGRIAMVMSWSTAPITSSLIDILFLPALGIVITRDILASGNWRNLPVCLGIALLALANILFHTDTLIGADAAYFGVRMGLAVFVCFIVLIGGRVIPNFTNNWFRKTGRQCRSQAFSLFDLSVIALTVLSLGYWVVDPEDRTSGLLLANAGIGNALRLIRWRGVYTSTEPIVWVMHIGYLWVPIGLLFLGLSIMWDEIPHDAGVHALTVGAIGILTVAVMTRVSLGHNGYALHADGPTFCIYTLMVFAATAQVAATFPIAHQTEMIYLAGIYWCVAFIIFCMRYGEIIFNEQ